MPVTSYWAEHAWTGSPPGPEAAPGDGAGGTGPVRSGVLVETADGRVTAVRSGVPQPPPGAVVLRGLTVPGLANAHSHAFHRALRGTSQRRDPRATAPGSFWTWRETMYAVADRLTPDTYLPLARAVYAEMALAGITAVGEFHYLHHAPGGARYADPNAMGEALLQAAAEAGIRITLLDTCYLSSGFGEPPTEPQRRFSDGDADAWAGRVDALARAARGREHVRVGAAVHSVRAVPEDQLDTVADWARTHGAPLHVHLSEQTAENEACLAAHGRTPTRLLHDHGVLGPRSTAVHATHLTEEDTALLGGGGTGVCLCPTTERDLADGIGPATALAAVGSPLSLGSDSHAVIDMFEEARAVELDERLRTRARGHFTAAQLLWAATGAGHAALGWPDAGRIAPGAHADLVTIALDSVRTAGPPARWGVETAVFAATAADVRHVVVGGRQIVADGQHRHVGDVPGALAEAITDLHP
ncbi:N-formimino-L-glutamate deiminase [Wenjunlia vitaminophila]|uniref:N-formimino-L-glutamate deiminase n=1 Tax=Wenjunlia vitaminophila TaxID=76728 RepID=A0A0T6LRZ1_WENVI|nr:formimidoylglutamate deiminase [Wenjunlia vitaminophila]KRV48756.1 N-formimino-L-glutamate deiminase [Wenjunlia vitaminophila]